MRFYISEKNESVFEISRVERKAVKAAIKAFEAGIEHASNLSDDNKESELAKYIANNFLDEESKKIARSSFFGFIYQLKKNLKMN